jgi:ferritin-like metal-binding protein YciE
MSAGTLSELLVEELKDLYSAEKQNTRALARLAKAAKTPELKEAFVSHLEETKGQIVRLDQIFVLLGKRSAGKTCAGMKGIVQETLEVLLEGAKGVVRDAALVAAVRRIEHYEMAGYASTRGLAKSLAQKEIVALLDATLAEELAADKKLGSLSKQINLEAKLVA